MQKKPGLQTNFIIITKGKTYFTRANDTELYLFYHVVNNCIGHSIAFTNGLFKLPGGIRTRNTWIWRPRSHL